MSDPLSELIKIAAGLVRSDFILSPHAEDYQRKVPKWLLKEIKRHQTGHIVLGRKIKECVDAMKNNAPSGLEERK